MVAGSPRPPAAAARRARATAAMRLATDEQARSARRGGGCRPRPGAAPRWRAHLARVLSGARAVLLRLDQEPCRLLLLRSQQRLDPPRAELVERDERLREVPGSGQVRSSTLARQRSSTRISSAVSSRLAAPRTLASAWLASDSSRPSTSPAESRSTSVSSAPVQPTRASASPIPRASATARTQAASRASRSGRIQPAARWSAASSRSSRLLPAVQVRDAQRQRLQAHRHEAGLLHERRERAAASGSSRPRRADTSRPSGRRSPARRSAAARPEVEAVEPSEQALGHGELQHHEAPARAAARDAPRAAPRADRRRCGCRSRRGPRRSPPSRTGSRSRVAADEPGAPPRPAPRELVHAPRQHALREIDAQAAVRGSRPTASISRSAVPVQRSSTRSGGSSSRRSTARRRQRTSVPAESSRFSRS